MQAASAGHAGGDAKATGADDKGAPDAAVVTQVTEHSAPPVAGQPLVAPAASHEGPVRAPDMPSAQTAADPAVTVPHTAPAQPSSQATVAAVVAAAPPVAQPAAPSAAAPAASPVGSAPPIVQPHPPAAPAPPFLHPAAVPAAPPPPAPQASAAHVAPMPPAMPAAPHPAAAQPAPTPPATLAQPAAALAAPAPTAPQLPAAHVALSPAVLQPAAAPAAAAPPPLQPPRPPRQHEGAPAEAELDAAAALLGMQPASFRPPPPVPPSAHLPPPLAAPAAAFKPGTIVWAKIEGHDWWPGQVVRRRAVPREDVGPPPGGPGNVMNFFPVVFMTKSGIPPEVLERLDTREGALAASLRAHKIPAGNEELEAEYAWVAAESLRVFRVGHHELVATEIAVNGELATCVAAAERVADAWQAAAAATQYDSDGGWGHAQQEAGEAAGAGHARRARGARSRGGRRVRSRRSGPAADEDQALAWDSSLTFYGPKIVVDAILGWRYPLSRSDAKAKREAAAAAEAQRVAQLRALKREQTGEAAGATPPGAPGAEDALLLLDFVSAADPVTGAHAAAPHHEGGTEREFLIKWADRSHIRNEWVPELRVMALAKRKLLNFTKKYGEKPVDLTDPRWVVPERFVARRKCPYGPGWEILVKWTDLGYECCTWESDTDNVVLDPRYLHLLTDFWSRQHACLQRWRGSSATQFEARIAAARSALPPGIHSEYIDPPIPQPPYVSAAPLEPHQLAGAAMLRRMYISGLDCIIADDPALGMVATMITFLQLVRHDFQPAKPLLVIVPGGALQYWKGEVEYWMGDDSDVIFYTGPPGARARIAEAELWLQPGALSGKVPRVDDDITERFSKPQVVITSMESMLQDLDELKAVPWDLVVLDERHASKSFAHKMYPVLLELRPRLRVSMRDASGDLTADALLSWAAFIKPHIKDVPGMLAASAPNDQAALLEMLKAEVLPCVRRTRRKTLPGYSVPRLELQLAVPLSLVQAECYRMTLARQFEQLGNHKAQRHSGQRASMLRSLCADICRVCNHPYTLPDYEPEADSQVSAADYLQGSGKLTALQMLLELLTAAGKRVVVAAHSSLDVLDEYFKIKFGVDAFHRVDESTSARTRAHAVAEFSALDNAKNLLILEVSACSLGTDLVNADAVVIYDSDGHPSGDIQSLGFARHMGDKDRLLVFRLYCSGTLEECIVSGGYGAPALGKALRPTTHRLSAADARLLEESLRFGVPKLFEHECEPLAPGQQEDALKGESAGPPQQAGPSGAAPAAVRADKSKDVAAGAAAGQHPRPDNVDGGSANTAANADMDDDEGRQAEREGHSASVPGIAQEPPALRPRVAAMLTQEQLRGMVVALEQLLERARALPPNENLNTDPDALPEALRGAFVVDWRSLREGGEMHTATHYNARTAAVEEDEEEEHADEEEEGVDKLSVSALASSSAAFWQRMLRQRYERLKAEELETAAERGADEGGIDRSASADMEEGAVPADPGNDAAGARDGAHGHSFDAENGGYDDGEVGSRRAGVRGSGRVRRPTKRKQEDDSSPPPGSGHQTREPSVHMNGDAPHVDREREAPAKKRRGPPSAQPASAEQLRVYKLRRQYETVMKGLMEGSSLINGIFNRASERIQAMAVDIGIDLHDPAGQSTLQYAMQAAQILLIMRPICELPSDFQDYTLVALIAVAANLSSHQLGSDTGIRALAGKYHQSVGDLKSVFNHIMGELAEYRASILQIREFEGEPVTTPVSMLPGAPPPELNGVTKMMPFSPFPQTQAPLAPAPGEVRQVDVFAAELEAIVNMDTQVAADKAGPLPADVVSDFEASMQWSRRMENLPASKTSDVKVFVEKVQQSAHIKRRLALLDLAHKWKIDAVQCKYQEHMESVRSRAQSSIDAVNQRYKADKAQLEATLVLTQGGNSPPARLGPPSSMDPAVHAMHENIMHDRPRW